jgi:voltage-gated potassium channel
MQKTNSFVLLWQAIKSSRRATWASLQVLIAITVVLAAAFYFAESTAQPNEYSFWRSLVWAFARYIEDPAEIGGTGPVTLIGRIIMTILGIVAILIFAVPAGIIGASFTEAIEQDVKKEHLYEIGNRLGKAFVRKQDPKTKLRHVPRYISLGTLQAKKNMTEQDVIDAIEYNPPFRLRNLAAAAVNGSKAFDQLVVEMFPYNAPGSGGSFFDRGSNVTIVCPTAVNEAGIGNFAFYLAQIGGFNYVSKENEPDVDEYESFYLVGKGDHSEQFNSYYDTLQALAKGTDHWLIFVISSERQSDNTFHFVTKSDVTATGRASTIINSDKFAMLFERLLKLPTMSDLKSECDEEYLPAKSANIVVKLGGGESVNAFTMRVSSEFVVWDSRYIAVAQTMADAINETLATTVNKPDIERLKERGYGYGE